MASSLDLPLSPYLSLFLSPSLLLARYGRKDFNDLFTLDLDDWTWKRINAKGKIPEPRSGHSCSAVRTRTQGSDTRKRQRRRDREEESEKEERGTRRREGRGTEREAEERKREKGAKKEIKEI